MCEGFLPFYDTEASEIWAQWKPYFQEYQRLIQARQLIDGGYHWWRSRFYDDVVGHGPGHYLQKVGIPGVDYGNCNEKFDLIWSYCEKTIKGGIND